MDVIVLIWVWLSHFSKLLITQRAWSVCSSWRYEKEWLNMQSPSFPIKYTHCITCCPKTGMFPVFLRQPDPQYTIFELITTSLSVVPFHFLPHLHLAGGRGLSANWSHDQNIAACYWASSLILSCHTNKFHNSWSLEWGRGMEFFSYGG